MLRVSLAAVLAPVVLLASAAAMAAKAPDTWDGLLHVPSRKVDAVYLLPSADFRGYSKVLLDPTEIAFRKNWQRDQNTRSIASSISNEDAKRILDRAATGFNTLFVQAYQKDGYVVATAPGPDVLRISTAVINLDVVAPDRMSAGRSWTFSREAGGGTLVVEARDSVTGAVLGRAVDGRSTGEFRPYLRNSVTNEAEFRDLFARWARISADGLSELKALSPVDAEGLIRK